MKTTQRMSQRLAAIDSGKHSVRTVVCGPISVGVAATANARLDAARLVGKLYSAEGYLGADHEVDAPFFTLHHLLPEATVFVAREANRVIGTLTVILDSVAGLPMESLYGDDVGQLRASGRKVCEICSLAVDPQRENGSSSLVLSLFKSAITYLVHLTDVTDALITLKPSHAAFYGRRLGFTSIGDLKFDSRFGDAETVAMRMTRENYNLAAANQSPRNRERLMAGFFAPPTNSELENLARTLPHKGLSVEELRARLADKKVGLAAALKNHVDHLSKSDTTHANRKYDAPISAFMAAVAAAQ